MVVKHRSRSSPYIGIPEPGKFQLPYGDGQLDRASSLGSTGSQSLESIGFSKTSSQFNIQTRKPLPVLALITTSFFLALCYSLYSMRTDLSIRDSDMAALRNQLDNLENALSQSDARIEIAYDSSENLKSQFTNLLPGGKKYFTVRGEEFSGEALYQKVEERQMAMKDRINELQDTISSLHRGEALEHFGHDVYRVMINLKIDDNIYSFIVEMAPLELMPHSVHHFMEMVKLRVWDNTVFSHSSKHILLAQLTDSEGNDKRDVFEKNNISTLSFPEYSHDYQHNKYTLGFGGRPGGPGFYINTEDNRVLHGPGGQIDHDLGEDADPCFAKVTEGTHVVDWMTQSNNIITVIDSIRIINED